MPPPQPTTPLRGLREAWVSCLPGCQHVDAQVPQPWSAASARGCRGPELAVWVPTHHNPPPPQSAPSGERGCTELRGAPSPSPSGLPGARWARGARVAGRPRRCQWRRVRTLHTTTYPALQNAGGGRAMGACTAEYALGLRTGTARGEGGVVPPTLSVKGGPLAPIPQSGSGEPRDAHPSASGSGHRPSPRTPGLSECRTEGSSDSQPGCHPPGSLPARVPGGWKGRFVTRAGLFPYRKTGSEWFRHLPEVLTASDQPAALELESKLLMWLTSSCPSPVVWWVPVGGVHGLSGCPVPAVKRGVSWIQEWPLGCRPGAWCGGVCGGESHSLAPPPSRAVLTMPVHE